MSTFAVNPADALNFFKLSPEICCVLSLDGRILSMNPAAASVMGYPADEVQGLSALDLIHPADRELLEENLQAVFSEGFSTPFEARFRAADGSYKHLLWNAAASSDRIYAVAQDLTRVKGE